MEQKPLIKMRDGNIEYVNKAVSFQVLGIGGTQFITLVLFEDGSVRQVVPQMIEAQGVTN